MENRKLGWAAGTLGAISAVLVGSGMVMPADEVPVVSAQATETVTSTATTTTATATTATSTTTTATATTTTATATTTAATATPTRTATATQVPPTSTPTTMPPTLVPTQPATAPINLTLQGSQEVPPVTTSGTGTFRATPGQTSLSYTLSASGLGSNVAAAHIHSGARGVNGPIVANFITTSTGTNSVNLSGTITQADLVGPMAGNMTAFMDAMRAGTLYVNVHSTTNPGGELRAQFPAPPAPPATGSTLETGGGLDSAVLYTAAALTGLGALLAGTAAVSRRRN